MRIDRDAAGLTQGHVEAVDDVRTAAEHGIGAAAAAPADHERERVLGRVHGAAHPLEETMRPRGQAGAGGHLHMPKKSMVKSFRSTQTCFNLVRCSTMAM